MIKMQLKGVSVVCKMRNYELQVTIGNRFDPILQLSDQVQQSM